MPTNFAERALHLQLQIDRGKFSIETVNELLQLYSRAVECYDNKGNEELVALYEGHIQNMLMKQEIRKAMELANSGDILPANSSEKQTQADESATVDIETQREALKKERSQKLKEVTIKEKMNRVIEVEEYQQAMSKIRKTAMYEEMAKLEV